MARAWWIPTLCLLTAWPAAAQVTTPRDLVATAHHGQRIDLSWTDASSGETGYRISRSCDSGGRRELCLIAVLPENSQAYRDVKVEAGMAYDYRVEAFSAAASEPATTSATTPAPTALRSADPPIYTEPQGAWTLGEPSPLAGIRKAKIRHNLASSRDLRILLDPQNPRSLLGRLRDAGYSTQTRKAYSGAPTPGTVEIYFYDMTRGSPEGPLPVGIEAFDRMGEEGYVLVAEVTGKNALRIVVGANSPKGLFRGGMTVQRLLVNDRLDGRPERIEPVIVLDYPDHPVREGTPDWRPMNANMSRVPDKTLDKLDAIARAGGTGVGWAEFWSIQEAHSWDRNASRSAAALQIAAADRFMDVSYTIGGSQIIFGAKQGPNGKGTQISFDQFPYYDGLGVMNEPFEWIESEPGRWQAVARRQGTLLARDSSMTESKKSPWHSERCAPNTWRHDTTEGRPGWKQASWRIDGPSRKCSLTESLAVEQAVSSGAYSLSAWLKASSDAKGISGSLLLELDIPTKPLARYSVDFPDELSRSTWTEVTLTIPDLDPGTPVTAARLIVRASLEAGSLWIDDVTLYEWGRDIFPPGDFSDSRGWSFTPGGIEFDPASGHRKPGSAKIEFPSREKRLLHTMGRVEKLQLEPGRYALSSWVKARLPTPHALSADDDDGDGLRNRAETRTGKFVSQSDTGTNPKNSDTDADGFADGTEVQANTDPNNSRSKPTGQFPTSGYVNIYFYDQIATGRKSDPKPIAKEYLNFPLAIDLKPDEWFFQILVIDVSEEMAAKVKSGLVQVRVFDKGKEGTVWVDDISFRRLDGDLRNLIGAIRRPILKSQSGASLIEGTDYEVCQIGSGELLACAPPDNYTTLLKGGLTASFNENRPPFEIRWLGKTPPAEKNLTVSYDLGAQYATVSRAKTSWDGKIFTRGELNFCDVDALIEGLDLPKIFGRILDGYKIENFPNRGQTYDFRADNVTWGVSEVRGINRSIACLGADGETIRSNAALFAELVNKTVSLAKSKNPNVRYWLWDDMFNPFNNGGDPEYQLKYGGVEGASACAYAPAETPWLCEDEISNVPHPIIENEKLWNEGIIMKPWSYTPTSIRRMTATSSWYQQLGVASQVLSGADPVNVKDWASLANTFDQIIGVDGTKYHANLYGGRSGLMNSYRTFWNHDWKLLYLHDNETEASSHYQIPWPFRPDLVVTDANLDYTGRCASMTAKFSGNNDGGICLAPPPSAPTVALSKIPVRGGASYHIDVLAQRADQSPTSSPAVTPPHIRVLWSNGKQSGDMASRLIYDTTTTRNTDWFDRYRVEVEAPTDATRMEIQITFGQEGEFKAADEIVIFESMDPCFDSCDAEVTSGGAAPQTNPGSLKTDL